jgi:hypothetical protein
MHAYLLVSDASMADRKRKMMTVKIGKSAGCQTAKCAMILDQTRNYGKISTCSTQERKEQ